MASVTTYNPYIPDTIRKPYTPHTNQIHTHLYTLQTKNTLSTKPNPHTPTTTHTHDPTNQNSQPTHLPTHNPTNTTQQSIFTILLHYAAAARTRGLTRRALLL